jgi:LmbE family N-acetylglucosaminyl deacetylase
MTPIVFAVHCHPDDIEFTCAGTLFRLKDAGCELHYMTVANGSVGSMTTGMEETARIRAEEARAAAALLGAVYHESIADDLEVFYTDELIRRLCAVVREVSPDIMLIPSPQDYMEDHMNTSRIAVTAAFCRGMPSYPSTPPVAPVQKDVVLYHAMPHGLRDGLRHRIVPDFFVDIGSSIDRKERMLAAHRSQKVWLDATQGMDSYLISMREMSAEVGRMSGRFACAEGWRRHNHLGLSARETDPLFQMLGGVPSGQDRP